MEPRFLSPEAYLEIAFVIARTIEGETQKTNGLWTSSPPLACVSLGKATEFNKLGFGRCQIKSELPQPLTENLLKAQGI